MNNLKKFSPLLIAILLLGAATWQQPANYPPDAIYAGYYDPQNTGSQALLQTADSVASAAGKTLVITPGTWNITSDLTITARVKIEPGATLAVATTKTMTLNAAVEAGLHQVFSCTGTGKVVFGPGAAKEIPHQWWGGKTDGVTDSSVAVKAAGDAAIAAGVPLIFAGGGSCLIDTQCKWGNTAAQCNKPIRIIFVNDSRITTTSTTIDGIFCFQGPNPEVDGAGNRTGPVTIDNPQMYGPGGVITAKALKWYGIQRTIVNGGYISGFGTASWSSNHDIADFNGTACQANVNGIVCDDSASSIAPTGMANSWNLNDVKIWNNTNEGINIFGGNNINIRGNFTVNKRDIVLGNHATFQPVVTKAVISGSYFEGLAAGGDYHIVLGGGAANGLVRASSLYDLNFIPLTRTACIYYVTGAVDTATVCRDIRNTSGSVPTYAKVGAAPDIQIYDESDTDYSNTSTIVGFSSLSTKKIFCRREGKRVYFYYYLLGTSNATNLTFTLPYSASSSIADNEFPARTCDNGTWPTASAMANIPASSNVVTINRDWSAAPPAFTVTGTKAAVGSGSFLLY